MGYQFVNICRKIYRNSTQRLRLTSRKLIIDHIYITRYCLLKIVSSQFNECLLLHVVDI